jgi:hypothetical protein
MTIAITGSSGLIGSALRGSLERDGIPVIRLVRSDPRSSDEVRWDPAHGDIDIASLAERGVSAVVHLAGAGVGDKRWTPEYKRLIHDSRVNGTRTIAAAVAELPDRPALISGSAIGYYGDTGKQIVDEHASVGDTFLAGVVADWEAATHPASSAGNRVCMLRTGLVVSPEGGAFGRMIPIFKAGIGGRLGSGQQWWSFISLTDEVRAIRHCIDSPVFGPCNLVAPEPVTNATATAALAKALHRPAVLPVPPFALRIALGEFAAEVTRSQGVMPSVLMDSGFEWEHPTIDAAITAALQ